MKYLSLFLILLLTSCSNGINPISMKRLSGNQKSKEIIEEKQLIKETTNTIILVKPARTVTVRVPENRLQSSSKVNEFGEKEVSFILTLPPETNTVQIVDKLPPTKKEFLGSFWVIYYILAIGFLGFLFRKRIKKIFTYLYNQCILHL